MIIAAAAAGVVDYKTFEHSHEWYTHENMLLNAFERQQLAKSWDLRLQFRTSIIQTDEAKEAVDNALYHTIPWLMNERDLGANSDKIYHMIADWFRYFSSERSDNA